MDAMAKADQQTTETNKLWYVVRRYGMIRLVCNLREDDETIYTGKKLTETVSVSESEQQGETNMSAQLPVTATNAPANEFLTREILESMNPVALRTLARERFSMTMPFAFKKPEIVDAILDQLAPDEPETPETPDTPEIEIPEVVTPDLAAIDNLANDVQTALDSLASVPREEPATSEMSDDAIAAKLAAHRERLASEATERAAVVKPKHASWQPTTDELVKRAGKLAYSVGALLTAQNRLRKETKVLRQVLEAMGELVDRDALLKAKQKMVEQFAHVQDRGCFPSPALASAMKGETLREAVWQELVGAGIPLQVAQLLGDQPDEVMVPFLLEVLGVEAEETDDEE